MSSGGKKDNSLQSTSLPHQVANWLWANVKEVARCHWRNLLGNYSSCRRTMRSQLPLLCKARDFVCKWMTEWPSLPGQGLETARLHWDRSSTSFRCLSFWSLLGLYNHAPAVTLQSAVIPSVNSNFLSFLTGRDATAENAVHIFLGSRFNQSLHIYIQIKIYSDCAHL